MMDKKKQYVVYKITNLLNDKIYIGVHLTHNVEDRYLGSGSEIKKDLKLLGRKNFLKEILFIFDNRKEMLAKEKELVTKEFCKRTDTYNRIEGGGNYNSLGMVCVKDSEGNFLKVYKDDPRYLSGELVHNNKGRSLKKGFATVKDKDGYKFKVEIFDERYLSGELVGITKGLKISEGFKNKQHTKETKEKMKQIRIERNLGLSFNNSQYGTFWITNGVENKKIKDSDIPEGWRKGRKMSC
jgi:hypothetical protein